MTAGWRAGDVVVAMHPDKRTMAWVNVLGGVAVLGSYAHGLATHPTSRHQLWGGVPFAWRSLYIVSMLLAAAGYLAFTGYLFFRVDPERARIAGGRVRFGTLNLLYLAVLVPSALWLPLTFEMLARPAPLLWMTIRLVLAVVGAGSLGLLAALLGLRPREPEWAHALAVAGAVAFCVQTALLDALVWPAHFR